MATDGDTEADRDGSDATAQALGRTGKLRNAVAAARHWVVVHTKGPTAVVTTRETARGHRAAAAFDRALAIDDRAAASRDRELTAQQRHRAADDPSHAAALIQSRQEHARRVYDVD